MRHSRERGSSQRNHHIDRRRRRTASATVRLTCDAGGSYAAPGYIINADLTDAIPVPQSIDYPVEKCKKNRTIEHTQH